MAVEWSDLQRAMEDHIARMEWGASHGPASGYLCRECGAQLWFFHGSRLLWCDRCGKRRRIPTHPALRMTSPPLGYHFPT